MLQGTRSNSSCSQGTMSSCGGRSSCHSYSCHSSSCSPFNIASFQDQPIISATQIEVGFVIFIYVLTICFPSCENIHPYSEENNLQNSINLFYSAKEDLSRPTEIRETQVMTMKTMMMIHDDDHDDVEMMISGVR